MVVFDHMIPRDAHPKRKLTPRQGTALFNSRTAFRPAAPTGSTLSTEWVEEATFALARYDYILLEDYFGLDEPVLDLIPADRRIIAMTTSKVEHDGGLTVTHIQTLMKTEAALYQVIVPSGLDALRLFFECRSNGIPTDALTIFAASESQLWSRFASLVFGANTITAHPTPSHFASVPTLTGKFGPLQTLAGVRIFGITGNGVERSLSPAAHNAAYQALGYPGLYLPFPLMTISELEEILDGFSRLGSPLIGLTTTSPLKEVVSEQAVPNREIVNETRSANVLHVGASEWHSDTTDDTGLIRILEDYSIEVAGKRVSIMGAGGSGRVATAALLTLGADVSVYNRGETRLKLAAACLSAPCLPLSAFDSIDVDVIVIFYSHRQEQRGDTI